MFDPSEKLNTSDRELLTEVAEKIEAQDETEGVKQHLEDKGLNRIESGASRTVYELPTEATDSDERLVVKFARPVEGDPDVPLYNIDYQEGWIDNWHEMILSRYDPLTEYLIPVVDHHLNGLWLVMPYAPDLPHDMDKANQLIGDAIAEFNRFEQAGDIEYVSHGVETGRPEIQQLRAWGRYEGEGQLRDYGGIVVTDEEFREEASVPAPFDDPDIR